MGIPRRLATYILTTRWLIERDALNNTMMKIGGGFHPPSVLADARQQLHNITKIVEQLEVIAPKPKEEIVAEDGFDLERKCFKQS
jgi:hypothetical protein